jgi:hypothetical protein
VEIWSSALFALVLWTAAAWLMNSHLRDWREVLRKKDELEQEEFDFRRQQFRRRMQTSAMLGVVGTAMLAGGLLMLIWPHPLVVTVFWGGVMLLVLWLGLLALADMAWTRFHFSRLKRNHLAEEARLQAELRRLKRTRGNGQADDQRGRRSKGPRDQGQSPD